MNSPSDQGSDLGHLVRLCREHMRPGLDSDHSELWRMAPEMRIKVLLRLVGEGHTSLALEFANQIMSKFGFDARTEYCRALALARGGNERKATSIAESLLERPPMTAEAEAVRIDALALLGRLYKLRFHRSQALQPDAEALSKAIWHYQRAYEAGTDPFPGINLATLLYVNGQVAESRELALRLVEDEQLRSLSAASNDFWAPATLGEAYLLLGENEKATLYYELAVDRACGRWGDIGSMRSNVDLIGHAMCLPGAVVDILAVPPVVVFAGHRVDKPWDKTAGVRFPNDSRLDACVGEAIKEVLKQGDRQILYTGGASGAEIICAEQALAQGMEVNLVLPCRIGEFCNSSVDYGRPELRSWRDRFDSICAKATVHEMSPEDDARGNPFTSAAEYMTGLALVRARSIGASIDGLFVLDSQAPSGRGSTKEFVQDWQSAVGRSTRILDLSSLRESAGIV